MKSDSATLKNIKPVIWLNMGIVIGEIAAGLISGSVALMVDALHNLGDVLAVIITYIAIIYGQKSPSYRYTFGYHRAEMMAAFINAMFLIVAMGFVLVEAVRSLLFPQEIAAEWMIIVAMIAMVLNFYSARLLHQAGISHHHGHGHDHDEHHHEHHHHDHNIRAAYLHMLGDALLSLGVVIGGIMIYFFDIARVDGLLALGFGLYILWQTWPTLKKSFESLMDKSHIDVRSIKEKLLSFEQVTSIHDLHITQPSSQEVHLLAHIICDKSLTLEHIENLLEEIRESLLQMGITHTVIQPETKKYEQEGLLCTSH